MCVKKLILCALSLTFQGLQQRQDAESAGLCPQRAAQICRKRNLTAGVEIPGKMGCVHGWGPLGAFWEPFVAISEVPKQKQQNWTEHGDQAQGEEAAQASESQLKGSKAIHDITACDFACRKVRVSCVSH